MRSSTKRNSEDCQFVVLNTTKGNDLRDGGKAENENKPASSIWLFLYDGKLTHTGWFRTSDMGLSWRGKVNVKSGSPHAELQLPLSHMHRQRQHQEEGKYRRPCISGHHARISSSYGSGVGWKQDPKQQQQQICSLPTAVYNPQHWGAEQTAWESHHLSKRNPANIEAIIPHKETKNQPQGQEQVNQSAKHKHHTQIYQWRAESHRNQTHVQPGLQSCFSLPNLIGHKPLNLCY